MKPIASLALILATTPIANAGTSIVGAWDFPNQSCETPIRITAMAIKSDDVNCQFKSIKRLGNIVTWKGQCDDAEGSSEQTVIAKLNSKGELTIKYMPGGNVLVGLRRCKSKP
jgi:hypothetical protein